MLSNVSRAQGICARFVFVNALVASVYSAGAAGVVIGADDGSNIDDLLSQDQIIRTNDGSANSNSGVGLNQSNGIQSNTTSQSNYPNNSSSSTYDSTNSTGSTRSTSSSNRTNTSVDYTNQNSVNQGVYDQGKYDQNSMNQDSYGQSQYSQDTYAQQATGTDGTYVQGSTAESYILSSGDRISISVFDEPELSLLDLTITSDETINYPLIGALQLNGKTALQVQNELTSKLQQGYLVNPRVTVTVLEYRPFYIQGGVVENGAMPYSPGLTVDKALALAGGLRDGVRLEDLKIGRAGAPYEAASPAQRSSIVNPGDVVYVPLANEGASGTYIYVYGEVNSPGRYQIYNSITVEQAIILAGGFTDFASKRKVDIKRNEAGEEKEIKRVKLGEMVQSNDVITIGAGLF